MTSPPKEPPILRLNHDLLLYILKMNANMFLDDDALETTYTTSQVCRRWRNFMLSMPSLWAKLIDLSSLQHRTTDTWRNELMRRTGTSLLWIGARKYIISDDSRGIVSFFFDVLNKNWHRIQKIVVLGIQVAAPRQRWTSLYLPAPNLQTFDVPLYEGDYPDKNVDAPLFSNDAPMLREFYSRKFTFNFNAPWLSHLYSLHTDIELTIPEILMIVKAAPRLRDLEIHQAVLGEVTSSLPTISLPDLSCLFVVAEVVVGATLVDHLELPPGCAMKMSLTYFLRNCPEELELCRSCMQTISRVAKNTFRLYPPQKLLLKCFPGTLALVDETQAERFRFHIWFIGHGQDPPVHITTMFLEGFTLSELSEVKEFHFENFIDLPEAIFASFIACLPSVAVLDAPGRTINYLIKFQAQDRLSEQADSPVVIFPFVQTVRLDNLGVTYFHGDRGALMEYLLDRIENGCPISTLDLTKCNSDVLPHLDFLDEMTGLKVMWKRWEVDVIFEYICGSGNPDRLCTFR